MGAIDPVRFAEMARFLYDSGVLKAADGATLEWPGSVDDWHDQAWMED